MNKIINSKTGECLIGDKKFFLDQLELPLLDKMIHAVNKTKGTESILLIKKSSSNGIKTRSMKCLSTVICANTGQIQLEFIGNSNDFRRENLIVYMNSYVNFTRTLNNVYKYPSRPNTNVVTNRARLEGLNIVLVSLKGNIRLMVHRRGDAEFILNAVLFNQKNKLTQLRALRKEIQQLGKLLLESKVSKNYHLEVKSRLNEDNYEVFWGLFSQIPASLLH